MTIRRGRLSRLLGWYVKLKIRFRKHRKRYVEVATEILRETIDGRLDTSYSTLFPLVTAYFTLKFDYKRDPLFGLLDRLYDIDVFVERGGGDCDDFAFAIGRVLSLLGEVYRFKVYFVTAIGPIREMAKWHTFVVVETSRYHILSPYTYLGVVNTMNEAVEAVAKHFETRYTNYYAISFDDPCIKGGEVK